MACASHAHRILAAVLAALLPALFVSPARGDPRFLTFSDRVEIQRAIERVYYAHQLNAARPFHEAVTDDVLERIVRTYLARSMELERSAATRITAETLKTELERIARDTRFPERLEEIYQALDHDPLLVQECFVRRVLTARLAADPAGPGVTGDPGRERRGHGPGSSPAVLEIASVASDAVRLPTPGSGPARRCGAGSASGGMGPGPTALHQPCAAWIPSSLAARRPNAGARTAVWTGTHMLIWNGYSDKAMDDPSLEGGARYDPVTDTWSPMSRVGAPKGRSGHTAVWTGRVMVVWGGMRRNSDGKGVVLKSGGRYDPATDSWLPVTKQGAPDARVHHSAVWTGKEMVVWGGAIKPTRHVDVVATGGRYDPVHDTWRPVTREKAPRARDSAIALWTGDRVFIWGGRNDDTQKPLYGKLYDPARNRWEKISHDGAVGARERAGIWTGSEVIVWGGCTWHGGCEGARYSPLADTWKPISTTGAPKGNTTLWTGDEMLLWGGEGPGGRYDPSSDQWTPMSEVNAPAPRSDHGAIWTGTEMIVWGGRIDAFSDELQRVSGGRYDPASDTWTPVSRGSDERERSSHTAVWTGNEMIIWGGAPLPDNKYPLNEGGRRYDPLTDS